jgi:8-oxo-dGTP pyrophosphatase MutT (NUDIX family)
MQASPSVLIPKVSIFVFDADDRLLVFEHTNAPSAGIQVSPGTLEPGEEPLAAAFRELCEETGKDSFAIRRFLARRQIAEVRQGREELHDRWFFQASPTQELPEEWMGGEWLSSGWEPFRFYWTGRATAGIVLTPDHADVYRLTSTELV